MPGRRRLGQLSTGSGNRDASTSHRSMAHPSAQWTTSVDLNPFDGADHRDDIRSAVGLGARLVILWRIEGGEQRGVLERIARRLGGVAFQLSTPAASLGLHSRSAWPRSLVPVTNSSRCRAQRGGEQGMGRYHAWTIESMP